MSRLFPYRLRCEPSLMVRLMEPLRTLGDDCIVAVQIDS